MSKADQRISRNTLDRSIPVEKRLAFARREMADAPNRQVYCKAACAFAYRVIEERCGDLALVKEAEQVLLAAFDDKANPIKFDGPRARWRASIAMALVYLCALGKRNLSCTAVRASYFQSETHFWVNFNRHTLVNTMRIRAICVYGTYLLGPDQDDRVRKYAAAAWNVAPRILANYTGDGVADGLEIMDIGQALRVISLCRAVVDEKGYANPCVLEGRHGVFTKALLAMEGLREAKRPGLIQRKGAKG